MPLADSCRKTCFIVESWEKSSPLILPGLPHPPPPLPPPPRLVMFSSALAQSTGFGLYSRTPGNRPCMLHLTQASRLGLPAAEKHRADPPGSAQNFHYDHKHVFRPNQCFYISEFHMLIVNLEAFLKLRMSQM